MPDRSPNVNNIVSRTALVAVLILHGARTLEAEDGSAPASPMRNTQPDRQPPGGVDQPADKPRLHVSVDVDFGDDLGQNFGSLFEAVDAEGRVVAGAGFLGAYNTNARSNRRALSFFVRPPGQTAADSVEALPRANGDCGVYLHAVGADLLALSPPAGTDNPLRVWNEQRKAWGDAAARKPFAVNVEDGLLEFGSRQVDFRGRTILKLGDGEGQISRHYYANGFLVFRQLDPSAASPWNRLVARRWRPGRTATAEADAAHQIELRTPGEFVYGFGQLGSEVLAATNTGGVYRFDGHDWKCLLEPDLNVSFQIYSIVNYYDRLLLGQYPTGNIFEYQEGTLTLRPGEPPVMSGVSGSARECQTLAIYGGDLYAGVWPWAELWRLDGDRKEWAFVRRMFPHPEPDAEYQHPYQRETTELNTVLNLWGQRITSLIPRDDALWISTSSKSGAPFDPKFDFLANDRWQDYGRIYRMRLPGHLTVTVDWTGRPTRFEFRLERSRLRVLQDGRLLGSAEIEPDLAAAVRPQRLTWGRGIYGEAGCRLADRQWRTPAAASAP